MSFGHFAAAVEGERSQRFALTPALSTKRGWTSAAASDEGHASATGRPFWEQVRSPGGLAFQAFAMTTTS